MDNFSFVFESRRKFLSYGIASTAGIILPHNVSKAAQSITPPQLLEFHPVRFVSGLIFDVAMAVVVDFVKDIIVQNLLDGKEARTQLVATKGNESTTSFRHQNYKASTVILGVANYEVYRKKHLNLLLKNDQQLHRYKDIITYMKDEKIRIKFSNSEYSQEISKEISPNSLFMIDYLQIKSHQEEHYSNLIELTQTNAFNEWTL